MIQFRPAVRRSQEPVHEKGLRTAVDIDAVRANTKIRSEVVGREEQLCIAS